MIKFVNVQSQLVGNVIIYSKLSNSHHQHTLMVAQTAGYPLSLDHEMSLKENVFCRLARNVLFGQLAEFTFVLLPLTHDKGRLTKQHHQKFSMETKIKL